jgi:hypothetical protein
LNPRWKKIFGEAGMYKNKYILILLVLWGIEGCKTADIPDPYNFRQNGLQSNPFGCWMEATVSPSELSSEITSYSGELLHINSDSAYLLISDGVIKSINNVSILSSKLYTHQNQSVNYILTNGLFIVPNILGALAYIEYAGGFLFLGIPVTVAGIIHSVIEGSSNHEILIYPKKNSLDDLKSFARYPAGLPENANLNQLYLKKSKNSMQVVYKK